MSSSNSQMLTKAMKDKPPEFPVNTKLIEFDTINISSPSKGIEQESKQKETNQDVTDNNRKNSETIMNILKNMKDPDASYNYKKDFLVLSFNQTEDQNSLEYKRKILSKKLMKDITFSLNKAFEFSFEDQIKNNIIMTLSKNTKSYYDYEEKKEDNYNNIDNQFILNLCNGDIDMNKFFIPSDKNEIKPENKDVYLGNKNIKEELENSVMEDEIAHAKKNYTPQKGPELARNLIIDEEFDEKTYKFFLDYIERFKEHPLASKIKLVLSYITEINPHTKRPIYTNKDKNNLLQYWKNAYDESLQKYSEQMKAEAERKKKEQKKRTKIYGSRETANPSINSYLSKKKSNAKISLTGEQSQNNNNNNNTNNTNSEHKGIGNFNIENSKQMKSNSRDLKK